MIFYQPEYSNPITITESSSFSSLYFPYYRVPTTAQQRSKRIRSYTANRVAYPSRAKCEHQLNRNGRYLNACTEVYWDALGLME